MSLAERLLDEHKEDISELKLIPGAGGEYEVKLDSEIVYSKKTNRRHPKKDEIEAAIRAQMREKRY